MSEREKTTEELLYELHDLMQHEKIRKLQCDTNGNLLLDPLNLHDILWYEKDEDYDVF